MDGELENLLQIFKPVQLVLCAETILLHLSENSLIFRGMELLQIPVGIVTAHSFENWDSFI